MAQRIIEEQNRYNELRADIWKLASDKALSELEFIKMFIDTIGRELDVSRVTYSKLIDEQIVGTYEWHEKGMKSEIGLKIPVRPIRDLLDAQPKEWTIDEIIEQIPIEYREDAEALLRSLAKEFDIRSVIGVPYEIDSKIEGLVSIIRNEEKYNNSRELLGLESIIPDIIQIMSQTISQKRAEESLRVSEEKYRTILDSIDEAYFETDIRGNLIFFNDSLSKLLGYTRDELMGMNNSEFMPPENARPIYRRFSEIYRTGNPLKKAGYGIIRKDGSYGFHEMSASLIRDNSGQPIGFRGIARDITELKKTEEALKTAKVGLELRVKERTADLMQTNEKLKTEIEERKKAEAALRESEEKYRILVESTPDVVGIIQKGRLVYVNDRLSHVIGADMINNVNPLDLIDPEDRERVIG